MNPSLTPLDRRRGWKSVREIGSPWRLIRLVREISDLDRAVARLAGPAVDQAAREKNLEARKRAARSFLGLLSMKRAADHYIDRMGMTAAAYNVGAVLDRHISDREKEASIFLADQSASDSDYSIRVLAGRKRELEHGNYNEDLVDPSDLNLGIDAFEVYRRGVALEKKGKIEEAKRMYARALESDPTFSLALRGQARLVSAANPGEAARLYSQVLEFLPKEHYGSENALHILAVYRNFLLAKRGGEFVAFPVSVGNVDHSSTRLKSPGRRFVGLLLMRLRLRRSEAVGSTAASFPSAMADALEGSAQAGPLAAAFGVPVRSSIRSGVVKQAVRFLVRKLAQHLYLFHFILAGRSTDELKSQIDKVDREWLSRTVAI